MSCSGEILQNISIAITLISTVLIIVGFSAPYWHVSSSLNYSFGLWQYCQETCDSFDSVAFFVLTKDLQRDLNYIKYPACLCLALSISSLIVAIYFKATGLEKYRVRRCTSTFVAGGIGIAASALFIHFFPENAALGFEYGWAFILFFTGSLTMMLTSFILCFAAMLARDED